MPTIPHLDGPYRFFFYSFDCVEREDVHGGLSFENDSEFSRRGMSTAANRDKGTRIVSVDVTNERIMAHLADGRAISVPLAWSWRLAAASPAQRGHYQILGDGEGIRWPDVDEDISVRGMLDGRAATPPDARS